MSSMSKDEIVKVMELSEGNTVKILDKEDNEWTGTVDVYESEFDNEYDDVKGSSICVTTVEGFTMLIYDSDIKEIRLV